MANQNVVRVKFGEFEYGITFFEDRIGVCRGGYGRVKYMPVVWKYGVYCFPELRKTRLPMAGTAKELCENIATCARIGCSAWECVRVCEHILEHGHTPR